MSSSAEHGANRQKMIRQKKPLKSAARAARWDQRWQVPGLCLVLAAITFAVFGQTVHHEFIFYDDNEYVFENPMVAQGLTVKGVVWAFTRVHSSNWHPLSWLSHMLDCQLYGLNPAGHHLSNVLLHTATVIALFLVLRQMTGAFWRSAFVAAVFAIHPLRVESVAWVAERKDVLSGLFFMLTVGAYVRYARCPWSLRRYGLVLLLFAMGLMCKPMLVTLPLVLLLLDYWPLNRWQADGPSLRLAGRLVSRRVVFEKLPLLALSAAGCIVTLLAQTKAMHLNESFSMPLRLANALVTCMIYLGQMVWPAGLAVFYPYPQNGLPPWEVGLAGLLLAGISAVAFRQRRKQPWLLMGWLWYLVMLLPVVGIIQVGEQAHADRYTYLPQIGIYMAVTWMAAGWGANRHAGRAAFGGLMAAVLAVLMVCAWKQTTYWANGVTLWTHTLGCTASNDIAWNGLGLAFNQKGKLDEAITCFQKAVQLNPDCADAHSNLGLVLLPKGRVDEAISHCQTALRHRPDYKETHINLGNAFVQKGRVNDAIAQYQEALRISPDYADAHNDLGNALLAKGKVDEAIAHYRDALEINPDFAAVKYNLGIALRRKENADKSSTPSQ